jgi:hypothetical protein
MKKMKKKFKKAKVIASNHVQGSYAAGSAMLKVQGSTCDGHW